MKSQVSSLSHRDIQTDSMTNKLTHTKSRAAARNSGSGTIPGLQESIRNVSLFIPAATTALSTGFFSFSTGPSRSEASSSSSTDLGVSHSVTGKSQCWYKYKFTSHMYSSLGFTLAWGVLRFELDRGVPLEPQNPYPSLRVILAKKGTHF